MWDRVGVDEVLALYPVELCNGPRCGRTLRRVETVARKRMPIDPDPVPDATVVIRRDRATRDVRAHVLAGGDPRDPDEVTWRAHWATCPDSDVFRRLQQQARPRCATCLEPLDRALVDAAPLDSWERRYHAGCVPTSVPRPTPPAHEQGALEL